MSTYGVRTRFVSLCADSGGAVSAAAFAALTDYAAERGYTPGELRALLRPASYLEASRVLRARGAGPPRVTWPPRPPGTLAPAG